MNFMRELENILLRDFPMIIIRFVKKILKNYINNSICQNGSLYNLKTIKI